MPRLTKLARAKLEEDLLALQLTRKRCEVRRLELEDERQRVDANDAAAVKAIADVQTQLKEETDG